MRWKRLGFRHSGTLRLILTLEHSFQTALMANSCPTRGFFPNGFASLAAQLGARGFSLGGYSDRGVKQCDPSPGSKGFEASDAAQFGAWNINFVKFLLPMLFKFLLPMLIKSLRAACQDYDVAQYNLGEMYHKGEGVECDNKTAAHWYLKAADQGYVPTCTKT
jgi:TPR repeat protein